MALPAALDWDIQTGGNDSYGGGFVRGGTGTDYSLSTTPRVVIDNSAITAVVQATTTDLLVVGYTVASTDIDNLVQVTGGTATAGFYRIVSLPGANTWRMDRAVGAAAQTTIGNMGGCLLTVAKAVASGANVAGNRVYVKSGTYPVSTKISMGVTGDATNGPISVIGYNTTHTDGGTAPLITSSTNSCDIFDPNGKHLITLSNLSMSSTAAGTHGTIIKASGTSHGWLVKDCLLDGGLRGIDGDGNSTSILSGTVINTEIKNSVNDGMRTGMQAVGCYIHDNLTNGIQAPTLVNSAYTITRNVVSKNGAAGILGTAAGLSMLQVVGNTIYNNTTDGIKTTTTLTDGVFIQNNIVTNNGGYGINLGAAGMNNYIDYNAFLTNTSGPYNNCSAGSHDVALSGAPYTNAAGGDFTLNNTAGAGAACRAAGSPGTIKGATGTGYIDIGAFQHQDSGGGATIAQMSIIRQNIGTY